MVKTIIKNKSAAKYLDKFSSYKITSTINGAIEYLPLAEFPLKFLPKLVLIFSCLSLNHFYKKRYYNQH